MIVAALLFVGSIGGGGSGDLDHQGRMQRVGGVENFVNGAFKDGRSSGREWCVGAGAAVVSRHLRVGF